MIHKQNNTSFIRHINKQNSQRTKSGDNQRRFHKTASTAITIQSDTNDKFRIGTKIHTKFSQGVFQGEIVHYQQPYYRIRYTNGEEEDLLHQQVQERIRDKKVKVLNYIHKNNKCRMDQVTLKRINLDVID